ncbi:MAG: PLP-dependent aminotransferase family protein [Gemmatimonadales bacterium]|nr:PLP-dependent aminotransferase family protein [Gemmatimonadales bacterium]
MRGATRVVPSPPERAMRAATPPAGPPASPHKGRPSRRANILTKASIPELAPFEEAPRAFRSGVPAVDIFPIDIWGRIMAKRWRRVPPGALSYGRPFGFQPLRQAVADYLNAARGVRCTAEQVLIVNGSQQGLDLAARVVLDPGDQAWLESPGYPGASKAFIAAGAALVQVPVDDQGLIVSEGRRLAPNAHAAFVTPSRQLPLGMTMPAARRQELLAWARAAGAWIVEDDYDSEFRYVDRPLAALQGLDPNGCVIYCGTFSKVTFPAVRLGYLVVPDALIDAFAAARIASDYTSPHLTQAVMADFITEGHFERHIRRMRSIYRGRQEVLVTAAERQLAGLLEVKRAESGMNLIGWLPAGSNEGDVVRAAKERSVDVLPLSRFGGSLPRAGLLLGYAGVRDREIEEGVTRLAQALEQLVR